MSNCKTPECRARRAAKMREYRKHNPEYAEKSRQQSRVWKEANPDYMRNYRYESKYGITLAEYEAKVEAQGGNCAICHRPPGERGLFVDHDHATGAIRELLCHHCNMGIGAFRDDETVLLNAADYIRRHK